jgi:hypothetical protein
MTNEIKTKNTKMLRKIDIFKMQAISQGPIANHYVCITTDSAESIKSEDYLVPADHFLKVGDSIAIQRKEKNRIAHIYEFYIVAKDSLTGKTEKHKTREIPVGAKK